MFRWTVQMGKTSNSAVRSRDGEIRLSDEIIPGPIKVISVLHKIIPDGIKVIPDRMKIIPGAIKMISDAVGIVPKSIFH